MCIPCEYIHANTTRRLEILDDEGGVSGESEETGTIRQEFTLEAEFAERKDPAWRIPLSIATGVGWLVFLVIWLFFYAGDYHIYQNVGVFLLSILIVGVVLAGAWAAYSLGNMNEFEEMFMQLGGMKKRMLTSIIVPFVFFMILALWLIFLAVDFDIYQNIAVVIVIILVMGGVLGVIWTTGGWKIGGKGF
jgi:hypothetical protein